VLRSTRILCLALVSVVPALTCGLPLPARATDPDSVCTGDPCVVDRAVTIDPGVLVDFETRTLRLTSHALLTVGVPPPDRAPSMAISAGSISLDPGARIVAASAEVTLTAVAGDIVVGAALTGARIDLSDSYGGGDIGL